MPRKMLVWGACALAALSFLFDARYCSALDIPKTLYAGIDQVRINAVLKRTETGSPLIADFAEGVTSINIQAYLDTGASGVLISDQTAGLLGLKKARFPEPNGPLVTFADVGVGGTEHFHVSEPIYLGLGPFGETGNPENPAFYTHTLGPIRTQISMPASDPQLEGLDVIGMPAMAGKVVVIDPRPADPSQPLEQLGTMRTFIYNPGTPFNPAAVATNPGIPQTSLSVKLSYSNFGRFTEVGPVGAEGPTLRSNPFIGPNPVLALDANPPVDNTPAVQMSMNGLTTSGSMLLDTGAITSMVSKNKAAALGVRYVLGTEGTTSPKLESFDINNPGSAGTLLSAADQFTLTLGGVGGTKTVAGFYLDNYTIPTEQGNALNPNDPNHLHYSRAPVLVNDISVQDPITQQTLILDGILGTNYLTGSAVFVPTIPFILDVQDGAFNWIVFDEPNGLLKLAPKIEVIPEPATCVLGGIVILGIAWKVKRRRSGITGGKKA